MSRGDWFHDPYNGAGPRRFEGIPGPGEEGGVPQKQEGFEIKFLKDLSNEELAATIIEAIGYDRAIDLIDTLDDQLAKIMAGMSRDAVWESFEGYDNDSLL